MLHQVKSFVVCNHDIASSSVSCSSHVHQFVQSNVHNTIPPWPCPYPVTSQTIKNYIQSDTEVTEELI